MLDFRPPCPKPPTTSAAGRNPARPFLVQHHRLAIDDHRCRAKRSGSLFDRRKPVRPVMTPAGKDAHTCRLDVDRQPIAVPFQLPAPLIALWRMGLQLRKRRLEAVGHRIEQKLWLCRLRFRCGFERIGASISRRSGFDLGGFVMARLSTKTLRIV